MILDYILKSTSFENTLQLLTKYLALFLRQCEENVNVRIFLSLAQLLLKFNLIDYINNL